MMQEMMQNLSFTHGSPLGVCEYIGEDFVGAIVEWTMRRGGASTHKAKTDNLRHRYRALLGLGEI